MQSITWSLVLLTVLLLVTSTDQNVRQKRQILPDQPRIITENGHLIFQSGQNHNITFRAGSGGVYIDNLDLKYTSTQTRTNKESIDRIRDSLGGSGNDNVTNRLNIVELQQRILIPLRGRVSTLSSTVDSLRSQAESNTSSLNTRLSHVEVQLINPQGVRQLQTDVTSLTTRVTALEALVNNGNDNSGRLNSRNRTSSQGGRGNGGGGGGGRRGNNQLRRRIQALEATVRSLQALLTTNECLSNPCLNGATCVDMYNGYFCNCPPNWQGPRCNEDVNECALYTGTDRGCQNGATCINTQGSFSCQCATNWYGIHCSEQHNDCTGASHAELCGHGTCINENRIVPGQPRYRCICENGWTTSGQSPACNVDINECAMGVHCSTDPPVQCINIPGSFVCGSCPAGFSGNGYTCYDVNECAINNGGCSTSPRVECINTRGSRACGPCPSGYQGDGVTCVFVGVCSENNGGCHYLATCSDDTGGFGSICTCPDGYVGSGVGPSGCQEQSHARACASSPCQNGAVCTPVGNTGFVCACRPGYSGTTCSVPVDACTSNPCQNGGTCVSQTQAPGYNCQCTDTFTGTNCEEAQQECGGYLWGQTGSFRYPRITGITYPHRVSCAWVITTSLNKILTVTFPIFSLEAHTQCNFDFLQIHDGPTPSSHMIGKFCGTTPPNGGSLNSTHNQLYFWFKSDATISSDGFEVQWTSHPPTCGGYLNGSDHGAINSPGYPGNYPHNRDCVWTVAVNPQSNIMFTFAHLALETHANCSFDYLEIRDGETESAPLIRRYCSSDTPAPIQTTGPYAYIRFHSDYSLSDRGFHITYAALNENRQGCGGTFSTPEGELSSPEYPSPYQHDSQCVWVIRVASGNSIQLSFLDFDLETSFGCSLDYLRIRDGYDQMAPEIGTYCGTNLPATIISSSNIINLELRTDESVSGRGFRAQWITACGGTFSGLQGQIQSPNWPEFYPHNRECNYRIEVPYPNTIRLQFTAFGLEAEDDCQHDHIEIHDGANEDASLIGSRLCGDTTPTEIMSTGSSLFIRFVTDGSVNNHGFQASYTAVEGGISGCGRVYNTNTGIISSPGHPNEYPHGTNCTWYINVTPGLVIRLTFNMFVFEDPIHNFCHFDFVEVYDNSSMVAESRLGRYCGTAIPNVVTSSDNVLVVYMQSDASLAREGFSASYIAINASTFCGSALTTTTGVITSPNFPNNYPHNRQCEWTITIADGNQIFVNITDLEIEEHSNCNFDFLEIRNGGFLTSPLVQRYCGFVTPSEPILSHSNRLYVRFKSDHSSSARGFRLEYSSAASGCGGDLTTPTGAIVSPNYPHHYSHNAECYWTITVSQGSTIALFFVDFDTEESGLCHYDYLQIREGGSNGQSLGKLCGSTLPDPIYSRSNRVWLTYRSDYIFSGRGFRLQYQANCNTRLTGISGVIESPNFPNPYHHHANCTWIIEAPVGNTVNVSFAAFRLEGTVGHCFDKLQVRDGGLPTSTELRTMCGYNIPEPIHSSGNLLWLNFVSDMSIAHGGFRLEWIVNGCGGYRYGSSGTIVSPNYPSPYPYRTECHWVVTVDTGNSIQLNISDFDLESSTNCYFDVLEVFAGSDSQGPRLTQLCHRQSHPQILHTTGTTAFIRFRSDVSVSGKGFSLTYRAVSGGCGGNFTAKTATITSINYPNNYEHNTECEWNITVARGHVVVLNFTDFQIESGDSCSYDYVNLYDGPDVNATLIASLCGLNLPNPTVYRSSGNQMFVRMRTDSSVTYKGFSATYTTGCGGTLNADVYGEIFSPGYPNQYPWNTRCVWIIQSAFNNRRVSLTMTQMNIYTDCSREYVGVTDGSEPVLNQTSLQNYCGNFVPATITSEGSALTVVFQSSFFTFGSGFRAVYSSEDASCGGEFTAESGRFISPNYPDGYPVSIECVWQIRSSPGNRVQLTFPNFQLDPLGEINDDYVEIRSPNVSGQLLGRWFGSDAPSNLTSHFGAWVKFRSNEDTTAPGFLAEYSSLYGGTLVGESGQVASPRYPARYPQNCNYRWTILVPQNMRVFVSFTTFSLESYQNSETCPYDYLKVYDGTEESGVSLGTFCGSTRPSPFYAETNQITLVFFTDGSHDDAGFLLNWQAVSPEDIPTLAPSVIPTTPVPGCGGQLLASATQQNITSPGYPGNYPNSIHCFWTMTVPVGNTVVANITSIDLESGGNCYYDYIRFHDGDNSYSRAMGTYCGRTANSQLIQSTTNVLGVTFHSDFSISKPGFVMTYEMGCGGFLRSPTGVIRSPNYPNNYPANQNCTWKVQVPAGKTIRLDFEDQFNIAGDGGCNLDYLLLLNGLNAQSPPLFLNGSTNTDGRYCGTSKPQLLQTSSNRLFINFVSDVLVEDVGFSFTYSTVSVTCGGELRLTNAVTSGYITSPNYPENYPHNVDCTWIIIAPASQRIKVDFEGTFYIEPHPGCIFDYVEFHDGGTTNSRKIGNSLCGTTLPGTVRSTGNVLLARFRTDQSVPHAGFKAKYSIATCGGRITASSGVITSPNYPANYGNNQDCLWVIAGPVSHFLVINITNFELQSTVNCTADVLEIRDGNATDRVLFQDCGYSSVRSFETSDSFAYIRFKSDASMTNSGFRISFQASLEECGGQLTTPTGVISSPNYPRLYAHRRLCTWDITVPLGRRVTLTFNDLQMEGAGSRYCGWNYVEVVNGYIPASPSLGRFCHDTVSEPVESSGNTMRVRFFTDGTFSQFGFRATYSSDMEAECGGHITEVPGTITSPGFDNGTYTHNTQCVWNIHNRLANSSIRLYFTSMSLEYQASCVFDFVEIREGVDNNGPLVGRYCGNHSHEYPLLIPTPDAWIRFRTDMSITHGGFQLYYEFNECGGILTDPQGVITTPDYPTILSNDSVACVWKIIAPEGAQIKVNFTDFYYDDFAICDGLGLQIQNGGLPDSPVIGTYCASNMPSASFVSQSNEIRLTMQSYHRTIGAALFFYPYPGFNGRRFKLDYTFKTGGCGGLFHSNQGSFSTPNYPSSYPHNVECQWDINVQNGYIVTLRFNPPFDLEASNCTYDYVEVFDALADGTLVSLGVWCHNIEPPVQRSSSTRLVVLFRSDDVTNGNGFSASWDVVCGGVFTNPEGVLYSPGYPTHYPNNLICNYTISPGSEHHIALTFTDFDLTDGYCNYDYIQAWQGNISTGDTWHWYSNNAYQRYLGKYCGSHGPENLQALGQMSLQFISGGSTSHKGFRAQYYSEECGGVFTESSGAISTPVHPNKYLNNINCSWAITVIPNRIIKFKFQSFNIELHSQCNYDYLSFYDGPDTNSNLIGRYCGNMENVPEFIQSTGNQMYINFITDYSFTSDGFYGNYWTTYGPDSGCGGVLRQSSGTITSVDGDGDGFYENDLDCEWRILVNENKVVRITITGLDIEESVTCFWDSLKIYDGLTKDEHILGTYCGHMLPELTITSSSNVAFVVFHSDNAHGGAGFNATFEEVDAVCGGAYNATTTPTTLTSPNYPNSTGNAIYCAWFIDTGDVNKQVRLQVTDLQLQDSPQCSNEYLLFHDRPMGTLGQRLTYCGYDVPLPFYSRGAQVKVAFFLATTSASRGFQLTYESADCNRNITLPSGRITSPGFPGVYPQNSACTIRVTSPENTTLSFYFKQFHIEAHYQCNWDNLEIRNSSSIAVARLCGSVIPSPVFLTDNVATLKFITDNSVQHPGYDITFISSSQGRGCGGTITRIQAGAFTSPGYPDRFPGEMTCTWYITPPARSLMWWQISVLPSTEGSGSCVNDYVDVYDLVDLQNPVHHYCNNQGSTYLEMLEEPFLIRYVSSGNGSAPIFRFEFDTTQASFL